MIEQGLGRRVDHWLASKGMSEQNGGGRSGYLLFLWTPTGYTLVEREGDPPPVGHELEDGGRTLVVTKIGVSPLPGDTRPCAYSIGRG
jgi:hypothetical protein